MLALGFLLEDEDAAEAIEWFKKAAAIDHSAAIEQLEYAAAQEQAGAAFALGVLLESGDHAAAIDWYRKAAALEHAGAVEKLAATPGSGEP